MLTLAAALTGLAYYGFRWHHARLGMSVRPVVHHAGAVLPRRAAGSGVRLMASGPPDIHSMTVPELKEQLRQRGLPVSGVRAALIARLTPELKAHPTKLPPCKSHTQRILSSLPILLFSCSALCCSEGG